MKHLMTLGLKIFLVLLVAIQVISCSDSENISNLEDTLIVRHKGADMPAYIYGNGSEKVFLIILHGGPGGYGLSYRYGTIKSEIEKTCAVVYFDQRGSGMSQGTYSKDGINVDIMAEDVLALVKVIQHKYGDDAKFFLMGHSWGGTLGPATLLKDQHAFKGWIDIDGVHDQKGLYLEYINFFTIVANEQIALENNIEFWNGVLNLVDKVDANTYSDRDFHDLNSKAYEGESILTNDNIIDKGDYDGDVFFKYNLFTRLWNLLTIHTILNDNGLHDELTYTNRLSEITIPALVLWGRHDLVVPPKFGQEAYDLLGSSSKKLVFFEKSGHAPMFNQPHLFADEVIEFINQNK